MKILNSKEAFEAMMAGRNIMCRAAGELMDFDDLSQFPATIFAMPGYEFCIKAVPDIEKQPEPEVIQPIEAIEQEATINTETPVTEIEADSVETDPVKLVEKFTAQIAQFTKADDVLSFRHVFLANGHLDQKDQQHLCKLTEDKLLELDPEQYTPKAEPEPIADEVIEVVQPSLIDQIENTARKQAAVESAEHGSASIDLFYKKKKQVLINRIYDMDSVETLERLAPAIPAAKLLPADHQELLSLYAQRKDALIQAAETGEAS